MPQNLPPTAVIIEVLEANLTAFIDRTVDRIDNVVALLIVRFHATGQSQTSFKLRAFIFAGQLYQLVRKGFAFFCVIKRDEATTSSRVFSSAVLKLCPS